jgi:hypothetical protein
MVVKELLLVLDKNNFWIHLFYHFLIFFIMFNFNQTQFTPPRILNIHICLGLVFLFFVFNANAQLSPVDPHPTPVGFACEPTPFDDEPCIQSQCDDIPRPRITTHPVHPVNIFNPAPYTSRKPRLGDRLLRV